MNYYDDDDDDDATKLKKLVSCLLNNNGDCGDARTAGCSVCLCADSCIKQLRDKVPKDIRFASNYKIVSDYVNSHLGEFLDVLL